MWLFKNKLSCLKTKKTYNIKERWTLEQLIQFPDMSQSISFVFRYFYLYIFLPISEPLTFLDRVPSLSLSLSLSLPPSPSLNSSPCLHTPLALLRHMYSYEEQRGAEQRQKAARRNSFTSNTVEITSFKNYSNFQINLTELYFCK